MTFAFLVALLTSIIGSITGVGSGILMKPILDLFSKNSVAVINLMSSMTVFSMSLSSIIKEMTDEIKVEKNTIRFLSIGSIIGGIIGKKIFEYIKYEYGSIIVISQSLFFSFIMFLIILYLIRGKNLKKYKIELKSIILIVGIFLGFVSAFLGIGGGPLNMVLLILLFSMNTKEASLNSIFIIFFSQIASIIYGFIFHGFPDIKILELFLMIAGGVIGGILGRNLAFHISNKITRRMFEGAIIFSFSMGIIHLFKIILKGV